ncbi:MAG TPA: hypothetical protein PLB12_10800 [Candidatus Goldiibacteriota bacterium]|nr:hypothetical protein [Candidatus Goldiibacteriota bacterium]
MKFIEFWDKCKEIQGKKHYTYTGREYAYKIEGDYFVALDLNGNERARLQDKDLMRVFDMWPLTRPSGIPKDILAPSYIWALMKEIIGDISTVTFEGKVKTNSIRTLKMHSDATGKITKPISAQELKIISDKFGEMEKRGDFYGMCAGLLENGFRTEAYLFLMTTWNFANFRYYINTFDIIYFENIVKECETLAGEIQALNLCDVIDAEDRKLIIRIYDRLSAIGGIQYTGASKIMSLMKPELFVMWDDYIRKEYKIGKTAEEYIKFLDTMKSIFCSVGWSGKKPLAKAIDEYNYVTISLEKLAEEKRKRKMNKKNRPS